MKLASSLIILSSALALCACDTPNNRRAMYSPTRGHGYWHVYDREGKNNADWYHIRTPPRDYVPKKEEATVVVKP